MPLSRSLLRRLAALSLSTAALASGAHAQEPTRPIPAAPAATTADSVEISPRAAMIRSFLLPGWGQAYVGVPGRGVVYFALESASLWMVFKSREGLLAAREREAFLRETGELQPTERLGLADARRQQVEDWITLAVFWALFAGADAYVAAQLADFTEHIGTGADGSLRLQGSIPVGGRR